MDRYPDELRVAINEYLDKGVDFLKYGGTTHWEFPTLISFSPEAQEIIVNETHARGLVAETHSTNPEGLRLSIEAGIDLIQHPELIADREMSDELLASIKDREIVCSMLVNTMTGKVWQQFCETLQRAGRLALGEGVPDSPLDRAEGLRYLTRFLAAGNVQCIEYWRKPAALSVSALTITWVPPHSLPVTQRPSGKSPASARS